MKIQVVSSRQAVEPAFKAGADIVVEELSRVLNDELLSICLIWVPNEKLAQRIAISLLFCMPAGMGERYSSTRWKIRRLQWNISNGCSHCHDHPLSVFLTRTQ